LLESTWRYLLPTVGFGMIKQCDYDCLLPTVL
jgi:hypothetical protein